MHLNGKFYYSIPLKFVKLVLNEPQRKMLELNIPYWKFQLLFFKNALKMGI
jgi:hypothetical protein